MLNQLLFDVADKARSSTGALLLGGHSEDAYNARRCACGDLARRCPRFSDYGDLRLSIEWRTPGQGPALRVTFLDDTPNSVADCVVLKYKGAFHADNK